MQLTNGHIGTDGTQECGRRDSFGALMEAYRMVEKTAGKKPADNAIKARDDKTVPEKKADKKDADIAASGDRKDNSDGMDDAPFKIIKNTSVSPYMTPVKNREIKYIALHYTTGSSSAKGNATRTTFPENASADFVVDDGEIYQYNPDLEHYYTWAVGATNKARIHYRDTARIPNPGRCTDANNSNTISIEMCSNYRGKRPEDPSPYDPRFYMTEATLANTARLVAFLLKKYGDDVKVVRHFDITGKPCPGPWCRDDEGNNAYLSFVQRCSSTPAPKAANYDEVDDGELEKTEAPPWPDFMRQFVADKTAVGKPVDDASMDDGDIVGSVIRSIDTPVAQVLAGLIKKNNANVPNSVVSDFVNMVAKKPELLKNVLKFVSKK